MGKGGGGEKQKIKIWNKLYIFPQKYNFQRKILALEMENISMKTRFRCFKKAYF